MPGADACDIGQLTDVSARKCGHPLQMHMHAPRAASFLRRRSGSPKRMIIGKKNRTSPDEYVYSWASTMEDMMEEITHVRPRWRKSLRSAGNGCCVEVALLREKRIGVRDSKDASGPILAFGPEQFQAFL